MKAGRMDRLIDIQRKVITQSSSGQQIETWSNLVANWWASYRILKADENFSNPQITAKQQVEFQIRFSTEVDDLTTLDRIIFPSIPITSPLTSIPEANIYDIIAVSEINRRDGVSIIAFRRADQ